jgi:hypothetical protein
MQCPPASSQLTTLMTSRNFEQRVRDVLPVSISGSAPVLSDQNKGGTGNRCRLDWNGYHAYTQHDSSHGLFRKEVIQPQVLLRLPCYDFTPIMSHTLGRCLPCGSACGLLVQPTFVM